MCKQTSLCTDKWGNKKIAAINGGGGGGILHTKKQVNTPRGQLAVLTDYLKDVGDVE